MEKSDLARFQREVIAHGAEAALPCNLSDEWIALISRDLNMLLEPENEDEGYLTVPLAMVIHLLLAKRGKKQGKMTFSEEELHKYFQYLHFELAAEEVCRNTDISLNRATLETIFTNRDVEMKDSQPNKPNH